MLNKWVSVTQAGRTLYMKCEVCGAKATATSQRGLDEFIADHNEHRSAARTHFGLGDAIARGTKAMGLESCTPCERRRLLANKVVPRLWRR